MSYLEGLFNLSSVYWWLDLLDITIVLFLVLQMFKFVRGTAAFRIFIGALVIFVFYKTTQRLHMNLISELLGQFIGVGFIALIVVFQQEIRKFLLLIASPKIYNRFLITKIFFRMQRDTLKLDERLVNPIANACRNLADQKTGALLVLARKYDLDVYKTQGVSIDAELSQHLLEAIFQKESPLHDGAVIISGKRILAASCVLPLSDRQDLPATLGLRHRAAIGVTENSDSLAIVVSEENGSIAVCTAGRFRDDIAPEELKDVIREQSG